MEPYNTLRASYRKTEIIEERIQYKNELYLKERSCPGPYDVFAITIAGFILMSTFVFFISGNYSYGIRGFCSFLFMIPICIWTRYEIKINKIEIGRIRTVYKN